MATNTDDLLEYHVGLVFFGEWFVQPWVSRVQIANWRCSHSVNAIVTLTRCNYPLCLN